MKTNVVMQSKDRNLFGVVVRQDTKNGFFNLNDLQESYNNMALKHGWMEKRFDHIIARKENLERIYYLLEKQGIINVSFHTFIEMADNETPIKLLKKLKVYKTTGARNTRSISCNPYLFSLVAMEMNPMFYAETIFWITDKLIINRIEAGNFYKELSSSISIWKPDGNQYITLARALNHIVFGRHEAGIRNLASSRELKEMEDLEKKMSFAIDMGYIRSWEMLLTELRKIYHQKKRIENIFYLCTPNL